MSLVIESPTQVRKSYRSQAQLRAMERNLAYMALHNSLD
jgi:hypothetical protein